jgi:dihydrofolate reductase
MIRIPQPAMALNAEDVPGADYHMWNTGTMLSIDTMAAVAIEGVSVRHLSGRRDVGGRRMSGSRPRPVIDRVAPQPPGLGLSPAGLEHRQSPMTVHHQGLELSAGGPFGDCRSPPESVARRARTFYPPRGACGHRGGALHRLTRRAHHVHRDASQPSSNVDNCPADSAIEPVLVIGSWRGWWGDNPPYHAPTFVLTHHAREPIVLEGRTTFHFVTDGIHATLERARDAAGVRDVKIGGGVSTVRQYLQAGLIDELHFALSPVLLGRGEAMFEGLDLPALGYRVMESTATDLATHVVLGREERE